MKQTLWWKFSKLEFQEHLDFVERALACGHPRSMAIHLPELVQQVLEENINGNLFYLAKKRPGGFGSGPKEPENLTKKNNC